ncbi:MAG TPA: hypothetical protein DEB63_09970 [Agrobacterium sp.]|uniref:BRO-N domain-containing protein n=1 Tax=Rhizobium TaxID=379 RepID=UPI000E9CC1D7|nr:hypothetical protein [Agrobacterium sp.]
MPRAHLGLKPGRPLKFVSESGLYKLIMRSDKPEARKFQDWVTRDVPAIRKTGGYLLNEEARTRPRPSFLVACTRTFYRASRTLNAVRNLIG